MWGSKNYSNYVHYNCFSSQGLYGEIETTLEGPYKMLGPSSKISMQNVEISQGSEICSYLMHYDCFALQS